MTIRQDSSHPTGVSDDSPRGGSEAARARTRKAHAALQLRRSGADWDEVAQVIGYPTARAALVATERALEKDLQTDESQAFMRNLAGARLDRLLRSVWPKATDPESSEHLLAVTKARELIGQYAKLFGLDAPTEMVVHSPTQAELDRWVNTVVSATVVKVEEFDIFDLDTEEEQRAIPAERT